MDQDARRHIGKAVSRQKTATTNILEENEAATANQE